MSAPPVRHAHLAELPVARFDDPATPDWTPLRHLLGVSAFGVNAYVADEPGAVLVERHDEDSHEELYVVVEGAADFTVGGKAFPARAGSVVFVGAPGVVREARATEVPARVLAIGAEPGSAFAPSDWEGRWLEKAGLA